MSVSKVKNIYWLSSSHASCSSNSLSSSINFVNSSCFSISFSYASRTLEMASFHSFPRRLLSITWRSDFPSLVSVALAFLRFIFVSFSSCSVIVFSSSGTEMNQRNGMLFSVEQKTKTPIRRKNRIYSNKRFNSI